MVRCCSRNVRCPGLSFACLLACLLPLTRPGRWSGNKADLEHERQVSTEQGKVAKLSSTPAQRRLCTHTNSHLSFSLSLFSRCLFMPGLCRSEWSPLLGGERKEGHQRGADVPLPGRGRREVREHAGLLLPWWWWWWCTTGHWTNAVVSRRRSSSTMPRLEPAARTDVVRLQAGDAATHQTGPGASCSC